MIWGDQWLCPCGWSNMFIRKRCRNCGEPQLPNEKLETWDQVIEKVIGRKSEEQARRAAGDQDPE